MTPNEKAKELFLFYYQLVPYAHTNKQRKDVAIRAVLFLIDEILQIKAITDSEQHQLSFEYALSHPSYRAYWEQVKQEINSL